MRNYLQKNLDLVSIGKNLQVFATWVVKIYKNLVNIYERLAAPGIFIYKILVNLYHQLVNQKSLVNPFSQCILLEQNPYILPNNV